MSFHAEHCFPTTDQIFEWLTDEDAKLAMEWTSSISKGTVCEHDDGYLCDHRAAWFAERIAGHMPMCGDK